MLAKSSLFSQLSMFCPASFSFALIYVIVTRSSEFDFSLTRFSKIAAVTICEKEPILKAFIDMQRQFLNLCAPKQLNLFGF
jgi:hypothetical protein